MGRTNVVLDDELIALVMSRYRLPSKRAAIDFALRAVIGDGSKKGLLSLAGMGWDGDLAEMRRTRSFEE